jgi:hypothetical protein
MEVTKWLKPSECASRIGDGASAGRNASERRASLAAATSNRKSSFSAAALVTTKGTLTFRLHPKQLVAFRSKATEIPYRGAAGGGKPHLMRPPRAGYYPSTWLAMCYSGLAGGT